MAKEFELAIIGAGTAGLAAGVYAGRQNLKTIIFEQGAPGGIGLTAFEVENYPGILKTTGPELMELFRKHAESSGAVLASEKVTDVQRAGGKFKITTADGEYEAQAVIITTGGEHRKLGVEGESKFAGLGVSYCATCDGPLFRGKSVLVVGGGNSAVDAAVFLDEIASKVYLSYRGSEFKRPEQTLVERLKKSKVEVLFNTDVQKFTGSQLLEKAFLKNNATGEERVLDVQGCFVEVGVRALTAVAEKLGCELKPSGTIKVDRETMKTSVAGVYAAGDVTGGFKQFVTCAGDGAKAAVAAYNYIRGTEVETVWH